MKNISLRPGRKGHFTRTLNKRVNAYFKERGIKKTGDIRLWIKATVMFLLFMGPFVLLLFYDFPWWIALFLCIASGIGMAGIGMNVMHDANHGSFSSKKWVNRIMGSTMYLLAGNARNWKVQHNMLHHTYTNVHGYDEDLDAGRIIRFSPFQKLLKIHRFQFFYAHILYGLLTINWLITTDFKQTARYLEKHLHPQGEIKNAIAQWSVLVITKISYVVIWLVVPMIVSSYSVPQVFFGFLLMHFVAGIILSYVFQTAHIMEETLKIPEYDSAKFSEVEPMVHQLRTTVNFATKNKFMRWYAGGLTHQIEHHIFPKISHVHYAAIEKIVRETAAEFHQTYHDAGGFLRALSLHVHYIKKNGVQENFTLG